MCARFWLKQHGGVKGSLNLLLLWLGWGGGLLGGVWGVKIGGSEGGRKQTGEMSSDLLIFDDFVKLGCGGGCSGWGLGGSKSEVMRVGANRQAKCHLI